MANKKAAAGKASSITEWVCERHGAVTAPRTKANATCAWCGGQLTQSTWTMRS